MKLPVFQAGKGDSILVSSGKKLILVDGGTADAYTRWVAPALGKLASAGRSLDLVCVSHSDEDHIGGIVQMLRDMVEWRIYDYQQQTGNGKKKKPKSVRPPEVCEIWNNGFSAVIGKNSGSIVNAVCACARSLLLLRSPAALQMSADCSRLAQSVGQAIELSDRISPDLLNIPLNQPFSGRLMYVTEPVTTVSFGSLKVNIVGPFDADLKAYQEYWDDWLSTAKHAETVKNLREKIEKEKKSLTQEEISLLAGAFLASATAVLGDRDKVTAPNLASTVLVLKQNGKTVIMAGDAHSDDITSGLDAAGMLSSTGGCHVNVLKVPHHGSEHNTTADFAQQVTADHYIFSGNGYSGNPDLNVLKAYLDSRLGPNPSANAKAGDPFKFWFNTNLNDSQYPSHMSKVEALVKKARAKNGKQFSYSFLAKPSFDLQL